MRHKRKKSGASALFYLRKAALFKIGRIWYTKQTNDSKKGNGMEVYIPPKKTYHKAGSQGELSPGGRKIKGKQLAVAAAALAVLVALVFIIGSCFGKKTAKVMTTQAMADSALFAQLANAYKEETGRTAKAQAATEEELQAAVGEGKAGCILAPFTPDINDTLETGAYHGAAVFYDTYLIVGPKEDPARVKHLGKYKAQDVLKHLSLLEQPFVHPASGTELQTKINGLLQQAGLTVGDWYVEAADDGQQMLQTAQEKKGYAFVSRENWALYGAETPELEVLNQRLVGMVDQYYLLAKPSEKEGEQSPDDAFLEWMKGDTARGLIQAYQEEGRQTPTFEINEKDEVIEKPTEV